MKKILMGNSHIPEFKRDELTDVLSVTYTPAPDGESVNTTLIPDEWTLNETVQAFTRENGIHHWQWADDDYPEWISCEDENLASLIAKSLEMKAATAEVAQTITIQVIPWEVTLDANK